MDEEFLEEDRKLDLLKEMMQALDPLSGETGYTLCQGSVSHMSADIFWAFATLPFV